MKKMSLIALVCFILTLSFALSGEAASKKKGVEDSSRGV